MASYALGIDIGGTFTDIVVYDRRNSVHHTRKVFTTPDDLARGVLARRSHFRTGFTCTSRIRPTGGCKGRGVCD